MVFQEATLFDFDALTVAENLTLAGATEPGALLSAVGLSPELLERRPGGLSGGQRRRVAIARALAARPNALLYDEPTAGLDPASARHIAELIRRTATERGLASLLVTHDLELALHVGDRISFLPSCGGALIPLPVARPGLDVGSPEGVAALAALRAAVDAAGARPASSHRAGVAAVRRSGTPAILVPFEAVGTAVVLLAGAFSVARAGAIRRRLVRLAPGAVSLACAGSLAIGLVVALQSAAGLGRFEAAHLLPEVAAASMVREVLPLLIGLLLAGRIGAAVSAEMGSYSLSGQVAALKLLGRDPAAYLAAPLLWAVALVLPLATAAGLVAGVGGLIAGASGVLGLKVSLVLAGIRAALGLDDLALALGKSLVFGLAITVASYRHGIAPKADPAELGEGATRGVVEASLAVVLLDCLITRLTHR